jgi:hypothetical protein
MAPGETEDEMPTTITLYHLKYDAGRDARDNLQFPRLADPPSTRAEVAARLMEEGQYVEVARVTVEVDDPEAALEEVWTATQNGVRSPSWSQEPPPGVVPAEPGYVEVSDEFPKRNGIGLETVTRRLGYKSTDIGDVLESEDGRRWTVDSLGFAELPAPPAAAPKM